MATKQWKDDQDNVIFELEEGTKVATFTGEPSTTQTQTQDSEVTKEE